VTEMTTAKAPAASALSVAQMLHLMRMEVDNAKLHGYAICCLMIGLDEFQTQAEREARRWLMPAIFSELKAITFQQHIRGLGLTREHFILAVFPHIGVKQATELSEELLAKARELELPGITGGTPVTISVGVGHNSHPRSDELETLIEDAETGLNLARSGGGDRWMQWRTVEDELEDIRGELDEQIREMRELGPGEESDAVASWGHALVRKIVDAFAVVEPSASLNQVRSDVLAIVSSEVDRWRDLATIRQLSEREKTIDLLERRITKLTGSLDQTESELKRIASLKAIDTGISSIYSTVQGLLDGEDNTEAKREMLKDIFEANLALRQ